MASFKSWLCPYQNKDFCEIQYEKTGHFVYKNLWEFANLVMSDADFPYTCDEHKMDSYMFCRDEYELYMDAFKDAYVEYVYMYLQYHDVNLYKKIVSDWIFENKVSDDELYYDQMGSAVIYANSLLHRNQELIDLGVRSRIWLDEDEVWRIIWDIVDSEGLPEGRPVKTLSDLYHTKYGALIAGLLKMCKTHKQKKIQYVRSQITPKLRMDILERDNFTCQLCGRTVQDGVKLEVDHKIPVSKGGTSDVDNLWTLCFDCNRGKSARILKVKGVLS